MNILEIIKDIFDDIRIADDRNEKARKEAGSFDIGYHDKRSFAGIFSVVYPQLIGFVVGMAFSRLFGIVGAGYLVFGSIGALAIGTYKSVSFDKISLKPAFIRNIIIMVGICLIIALTGIFNKVTES